MDIEPALFQWGEKKGGEGLGNRQDVVCWPHPKWEPTIRWDHVVLALGHAITMRHFRLIALRRAAKKQQHMVTTARQRARQTLLILGAILGSLTTIDCSPT